MIQIGNYTIACEANLLVIITGSIALAVYSFFVYKYTIPQISRLKKALLLTIRISALLLILFLIFEPLFIVETHDTIKPVNLVMVDNSRSIILEDSTSRVNSINDVLQDLGNSGAGKYDFYSFGDKVQKVASDSLARLSYNETRTNFENILSLAKQNNENLASITIISDGIVNDGFNPVYELEQLGVPIFTVGTGHTTKEKDVFIKNVFYNRLIYQDSPTQIATDIANENFSGKNITISLLENGRAMEEQTITLSESGINRVMFDYTAESPGEKRMAFSISTLDDEKNTENNYKSFYINVLKNKLKIVLVAGSPSADLRVIKSSLEANEQFDVSSIVQVNSQDVLNYSETTLDSAEVLFLIDFPKRNINPELRREIDALIENKNIPFFFALGSNEPQSLISFIGNLPFTIDQMQSDYFIAQPVAASTTTSLLIDDSAAWNNMPPVYYNGSRFKAKTGTTVLLNAKIRNINTNMPLVLANKTGRRRNIAVLASEIWKWKLQSNDKTLFDNFLYSSVKWLNADNNKSNFIIETDRKFYSSGEEVLFSAQLYDESLQPIDNADIKVNINNTEQEMILNSLGNGVYTGSTSINKPGDYTFNATASENNIVIENGAGKFSVGNLNLESQNTRLDDEYLKLISSLTGGIYYPINNSDELKDKLENINRSQTIVKTETHEYKLWSSEIFLIIIISLFGLEWFIRKKEGML